MNWQLIGHSEFDVQVKINLYDFHIQALDDFFFILEIKHQFIKWRMKDV